MASELTFRSIFQPHKLAVIPTLRSRTQSHRTSVLGGIGLRHFRDPHQSVPVMYDRLPFKNKGRKYGFNSRAVPVVVCSTRYVSHKPKCTRVYKYRITPRPWFDRARYTLETAQVKPLLCLGRMQTMKTPVFNSIWLAGTAYVVIYALYVFIFRALGS